MVQRVGIADAGAARKRADREVKVCAMLERDQRPDRLLEQGRFGAAALRCGSFCRPSFGNEILATELASTLFARDLCRDIAPRSRQDLRRELAGTRDVAESGMGIEVDLR